MPTKNKLTDTEQSLVQGLRAGNKEALSGLYDRYAPSLLGLISRIVGNGKTAEDLLQATFLQVWMRRMEYNPEVERPFIWLMHIAKEVASAAVPAQEQALPDTPTLFQGEGEQLHKAVLEMVYFNVYKLPQITARLNMTEDAIKSTLKCALYRIKTEEKV